MIYLSAIVLAAGKGLRFRSKIPKLLAGIDSRPIIVHSLEKFSVNPLVRDIILVVNSVNKERILKKVRQYKIKKIKAVVFGGSQRQDSVRRGLEALDRKSDLVLIHDAARPFVHSRQITAVIREAKKSGAAILGVPVKATIKKVSRPGFRVPGKILVRETIDRSNLWEIQTPQVFRKDLILKAYQKFGRRPVTDDASLVEKLGAKVRVVMGAYSNIKITTPEDLIIAKAIWNIK